jgi:WD40 repeat protein
LQVPDAAAGKKLSCPKCGQRILVPTPPRPTPAPVNKTVLGKIEESAAGKAPVSSPVPSSAAVAAKPPIPVAAVADPANPAPRQTPKIPVVHVHGKRSRAAHAVGIASLVLGCLTLVLSLIPCVGMLSLPLSALGLLLAFVGVIVCVVRKGSGIGFPIAGAAVNGLALVIGASWALLAASLSAPENRRDQPPQFAEPLKKEPTKEGDAPIVKKETVKETKQDDPPGLLVQFSKDPGTPAASGKIRLTLDPGGHIAPIRRVLFTPDGKRLITAGDDHSIRIWDVSTGQSLRVLRPPGVPIELVPALSADGKRLAVSARYFVDGKEKHLIYLMLLDGRIERVLQGHTRPIVALAFSADGKLLASSSWDKTTRIWNLTGSEPDRVIESDFTIGLAFSPSGTQLAETHADGLSVVRDLAGAKVVPLAGPKTWSRSNRFPSNNPVAWSADGATIAICSHDDGVWLFEPDGKLRHHLMPNIRALAVAFSSDSRRVLASTQNGSQRAWIFDARTGKQDLAFIPKGLIFAQACNFSPDGDLVATAGALQGANEIRLWKTANGALVTRMADLSWFGGVKQLRAGWSTDGKSVCWRNLENLENGPATFSLAELQFKDQSLTAAQFRGPLLQQGSFALRQAKDKPVEVLKDGEPLAVSLPFSIPPGPGFRHTLTGKDRAALAWGFEILVVDLNTGRKISALRHAWAVYSAAPSPDSRYLVSLANDDILRIWDPERAASELLSLYVFGQDWICWTPEGYYAASPEGEKIIGFIVDNGIDRMPSYHAAQRFHKQLYRPDVIKLVLETGSVAPALKEADRRRGTETRDVTVANLLPPRAVLTVSDQSKLPTVKLKVQAEASVKEQPITSLRLMMDGRIVPGKEMLVEFKDGTQKAEKEWTFELPEGEHQLAVLARCPDSSAVSAPIRLKHVEAAKLPTLHVLTIGINNYQDAALDLKYAAPDAEALAAAFAKNCKGQPFRDVKTKTLLNKDATAKTIAAELAELRKSVAQQDLVIVFFACHGVKHKKEYYLLTHEADTENLDKTCLSGDALRKTLAEYKCQVLLMLDACHSAGFGEGKKLSKLGMKPATDDVARDLTEDDYGVAVMCAAMGHEKAEGKGGHGLFTQAMLEAMEKKPGVPVPFNRHNQRVYIHHLQAFVFDEVSARSEERQHPFLSLPWVVESFVVR